MKYNSPITDVKGIGAKTKESFAKMGVYTVGDILLSFPRTYIQYPKMKDINELTSLTEERHAIVAKVQRTPVVKNTARMQLILYRMPYLKSTLTFGKYFVFYGKVTIKNKKYVMEQPVIYEVEKYQTMEEQFMPVYSLTAGITNNLMTKTLQNVLSQDNLLMDYLPIDLRRENELCEYNYAIKQIHFPDSMDTLIDARNRLVFDEFFLFLMGIQYQKEVTVKEENTFSFKQDSFVEDLITKLPYSLTGAQLRSINQIREDMSSPYVMQRLLQGDVGSGKTIVAFLMMAWCSYSGYQSAIMAPTEVLARQHYESYLKLCQDFGLDFPVIFLSGSMTAREKRSAYEKLQLFPNAMIIGTHALIQDKVEFAELALVITDEQHRFGVKQRDVFAGKGHNPHILVMSATPIPRTLAIIIYGDMDISVIDEVPAKRLPIKNCVVNQGYRPKAYEFMEQQIREGHQVYIICPLVEETENSEGENVVDYAKKLSKELPPDIQIGILHGKMKAALKNEVMEAFEKNEIQILISTTVVEVGVNVPNATVMMVENADKFGLAQLHQLRGRVGRGDAQSYCIMVNTSSSKTAQKRLEILNKSNDGFFIASEDLKLRGPGDFFGIRQSGDIAFRMADIYQDADVLMKAQEAVKSLLEEDPELSKEEHQILFSRMQGYMESIIL